MGSVSMTEPTGSAIENLGSQILLDKTDRLRELNVGAIIALPQIVVVGDQSSGKSSVLESLTGFSFPRAVNLCTRYATQITCRRESHSSVLVSIIPRPRADEALQAKLRKFRRYADEINGSELSQIFEEVSQNLEAKL